MGEELHKLGGCPLCGGIGIHACAGRPLPPISEDERARFDEALRGAGFKPLRHCPSCNSQRRGAICWKCGAETFEPAPGWDYPELPPIERIRALAKEVGYALAVHGSQERDLDVIAVPWTEEAIGNASLVKHIAEGLGARVVETERKPLGRYAATIQMDGWYKLIDLSVAPRLESTHFQPTAEVG